MMQVLRSIITTTKEKIHGKHYFVLKLMVLFAIVFLAAGLFPESALAASGLKIYQYATSKVTTYTDKQVTATLNQTVISNKRTPGILVNGVAMLPYNDIFEKSVIAADCDYDKAKGTISISKYGKTVQMTIGSTKASLNGKVVTLPVAPMKVKYMEAELVKVLVPSRFISEALGFGYTWNSNSSTVAITKSTMLLSYNNGEKFEYTGALGKVTVNGKSVGLGNMPSIITNNTAMLRAKRVFADSSIGATYTYNNSDKTVTLAKGGNTLVMTIGSKTAYLNGNAMKMDTAPMIVTNYSVASSYVMVPGGFTASCLGYNYKWNNATRTSTITLQSSGGSTGNSGGSGSSPELGDSGVITETGTILSQWTANETLYGKNSGVHELSTTAVTGGEAGTIYSVTREYNNATLNSETFSFTSTGVLGNITSSSSDKAITIHTGNTICPDQTIQTYGVNSNLINTIGTFQNKEDQSSRIELNLISSAVTYSLAVSADRTILYVTVYTNALTSAVIGTGAAGDYITLTGIDPLNMAVIKAQGYLTVDLPYTANVLGDISTNIASAKYLTLINSVAYVDKLQLVIGLNDGYEYYTSQNGNQTTLLFLSPGASGQQNGASGSAGNSGSSGVVDKSGYEIAIPKPAGLTKAMITDEDNYFNNNFVIRLNGDYTSQISSANISNSSSTVSGITVSLNSSNQTEICFRTTKLQGFEYVMDDTGIYVNVGNPKDIYKNIVVLDPGHGGGAVGAQYFGTDEKDLNFKILYTIGKKYFNQDTSKLKVYYTRITDVDMSLSDRAAFASRYGADVFVSLHMNASLTRSVYGTEVYYSSSNTGTTASGLTSDVMADFFADRVTSAIGSDNRGSRSERYTVVYKNTVPAILIELGFLSNASDYAKLSDSAYQETAAKAIYDTLLQLFAQYPTGR